MKNLPSIRLNDLLTILNISQKDFAASLALSGTTIGNLLIGKHKIDKNFALSLAYVYNVNPTWLMDGVGQMFLRSERPLVREDVKELIPILEKLSKTEIIRLKKILIAYIDPTA